MINRNFKNLLRSSESRDNANDILSRSGLHNLKNA